MNNAFALLASIALAVPFEVAERHGPLADNASGADVRAAPEAEDLATGLQPPPAASVDLLQQARRVPLQHQVRIEQRVIIRISPPSSKVRERTLEDVAEPAEEVRLAPGREERCVRMNDIKGVQPTRDNSLLLFMSGRRLMSARLERSCSSQDFYSGFYVERSEDGRLCVRRERLQSRAGAQCEIAQINRLVAEDD